MKKNVFYLLISTMLFTGVAQARGWDYATGGNNGGYQQPAQARYQRQVYGQTAGSSVYRGQQTQQNLKRSTRQGNRGRSSWNEQSRRNAKDRKRFYVSPRVGMSYINFLDSGDEDFSGVGLALSGAVGMYLGKNFRADVEVGYHFERELASYSDFYGSIDVNYSQMDFMLNGYYDFNNVGKLVPFVGAGVGLFNSEMSMEISTPYYSGELESVSDTVFGVALAGGASYPINDTVSAEGMVRGKYLFDEGSAINLEALAGLRFSF